MLKFQLQLNRVRRYRRKLSITIFAAMIILLAMLHSTRKTRHGRTIFSMCFFTCDRSKNNFHQEKCHIPKLDPFHSSIKSLIKAPIPAKCDRVLHILFNSTLDSHIVPVVTEEGFRTFRIKSCCYRTVERAPLKGISDNGYSHSSECYPLSLKSTTKIPDEHEFISIFCQELEAMSQMQNTKKNNSHVRDVHAFVPKKLNLIGKLSRSQSPSLDRPNVIIFGIDSVSRMNFIRTMPLTRSYIKNKLKGVELRGYNTIGDSTFTSVIPMLSSLTVDELTSLCEINKTYDSCPFIWNTFSDAGYVTSFAEDAPNVAIFNYMKSGFKYPPTDYYLRPLAIASDELFARHRKSPCQGPRLGFQNLLDYLKKLVYKMDLEKKPLFSFTWGTSLTHNFLNDPALADSFLKDTLQWFHDSGKLQNTLIILLSDHGMRYGEIRKQIQGDLEEKLPFMFFIFPKDFRKKYAKAYKNLKWNSGRLTTVLDLYYTLIDILNTSRIESRSLGIREIDLKTKEKNLTLPRGISLFLPIPESRSCADTIIPDNFCACNPLTEIPVDSVIEEGATFAVAEINKKLENQPNCAKLSLKQINTVQKTHLWKLRNSSSSSYVINFDTNPGQANFEVLASLIKKPKKWVLSGSISRTNLYENQSDCVDERHLKNFCYCIT